jgi:hypothetical protein
MPTAQSRANLKYYHKRSNEDPEYSARIALKRMERYYANYEENKTKAREYQRARKETLRQNKIEVV